jgi:hypothetical protein
VSEQAETVERLVNELIATGTLWPETQADLERFVAEAKAGTLWADDYNYVVALHAKITGAPAPEPADAPSAADGRFAEVKRRFIERYHPETGTAIDIDPDIRRRIYADFLAELEDVEKT